MIILVTKRVDPPSQLEFHPRLDPHRKWKRRLRIVSVTVFAGLCVWLFLSLLLE